MARYTLGFDFGGSGGRCALLDLDAGTLSQVHTPWRFDPAPNSGGLGFNIDLERSWSALCSTARQLLGGAGIRPDEILGVAAGSLRMADIVLDRSGKALHAVPNRDARAVAAGLRLASENGDALYAATGRWPLPIYTAARLLWLAEQRPADFAAAHTVLPLSGWLGFRLCGTRASDPTQAGETLLFDLEERAFSDVRCRELGIPREWLPEIREPGSRLGELLPEVAAELGLDPGTPVAVGGADTQLGLLGCGAVSKGERAAIIGSTSPVQLVLDRPLVDPGGRVWSAHHALNGVWLMESNAGPVGESLEWASRLLYPSAGDPIPALFNEARASPPGSLGMLSSLGAEVMNARAPALAVGQITLSPIPSRHDPNPRPHLARSILEGMACALRANLEQLEAASGYAPATLRVGGRLARNPDFTSILTNILGREVGVSGSENCSGLGAALCAAVGAGLYPDLRSAVHAQARLETTLEPDPGQVSIHADLYGNWQRLRDARQEADRAASEIMLPAILNADSP
jgi:autoinducer 2 (AI-2) kinase